MSKCNHDWYEIARDFDENGVHRTYTTHWCKNCGTLRFTKEPLWKGGSEYTYEKPRGVKND